jgi:predicted metal-binding protein
MPADALLCSEFVWTNSDFVTSTSICEAQIMTNTENMILDTAPDTAPAASLHAPKPTLFVCILCRSSAAQATPQATPQAQSDNLTELTGGQQLINQLSQVLTEQGLAEQIHLHPVRCMGACNQSCVAALAAPNKLTFVFNQLSTAQTADLVQLSRQYLAQPNGNVPYKERPLAMRSKLMVVLPAMPLS